MPVIEDWIQAKGNAMRYAMSAMTFCIALTLTTGCTTKDRNAATLQREREDAAAQVEQANKNLRDAQQAEWDYTYAQRAEFVTRMKENLAGIQSELDRLNAKVERTSGATKAEASRQLDDVRKRWVEAKRQLDLAESAKESDWDKVKGGFKTAMGDLKDSFDKTRQWLSDKIEP